jgi:hypothetical protein
MTKKPQIEKFREKARELGIDLDEAKFDAALRKMAHGTPQEQQEATDEIGDMLGQKDPNASFGKGPKR